MKPEDFKTLVEIVNGIVATLAILTAGWWFFINRSLAGTLRIKLTLTDVITTNDPLVAIVRVNIQNVGRTRIKKDYCNTYINTNIANAWSNSTKKPINIITIQDLKLERHKGREIFERLTEVEPNEETYEDVAFVLDKVTYKAPFFAVGVHFKTSKAWFNWKKTTPAWSAIAIFNADDKAKVPSTADPLAEHAT